MGFAKDKLIDTLVTGECKTVITMVYFKDNKVSGYGCIHESQLGYRITPLYADNSQIADTLIIHLIQKIPLDKEIVYNEIQHENTSEFKKKFCKEEKKAAYLQYTNKFIQEFNFQKVFSFPSFMFS